MMATAAMLDMYEFTLGTVAHGHKLRMRDYSVVQGAGLHVGVNKAYHGGAASEADFGDTDGATPAVNGGDTQTTPKNTQRFSYIKL